MNWSFIFFLIWRYFLRWLLWFSQKIYIFWFSVSAVMRLWKLSNHNLHLAAWRDNRSSSHHSNLCQIRKHIFHRGRLWKMFRSHLGLIAKSSQFFSDFFSSLSHIWKQKNSQDLWDILVWLGHLCITHSHIIFTVTSVTGKNIDARRVMAPGCLEMQMSWFVKTWFILELIIIGEVLLSESRTFLKPHLKLTA